jgi:two-component system OmpR family response regulator
LIEEGRLPQAGGSPGVVSREQTRVLVCDDAERLAELTAGLLTHHGFFAEAVGDGGIALDRIAHADRPFDVLLLDLHLRGKTSSEVVHALRNTGIRVILTSGYSAEDVPEELRREPHVTGYLPKPYPVDRLVSVIRSAIDSRSVSRASA